MRLKNKKTGIIHKIVPTLDDGIGIKVMSMKDGYHYEYKSLADFNKEWEDAPEEEPKRTWFIDTNCVPNYIDYGDNPITDHCYDDWNELGICFETKEEAEKAVEKLKAWKRLKDGGVKFELASIASDDTATIFARFPNREKFQDLNGNLFKIFGGEE